MLPSKEQNNYFFSTKFILDQAGNHKKVIFLVARPQGPYPPPPPQAQWPSELFFCLVKNKLQKKLFFLSGPNLTPLPLLVARPLKKEPFLRLPLTKNMVAEFYKAQSFRNSKMDLADFSIVEINPANYRDEICLLYFQI